MRPTFGRWRACAAPGLGGVSVARGAVVAQRCVSRPCCRPAGGPRAAPSALSPLRSPAGAGGAAVERRHCDFAPWPIDKDAALVALAYGPRHWEWHRHSSPTIGRRSMNVGRCRLRSHDVFGRKSTSGGIALSKSYAGGRLVGPPRRQDARGPCRRSAFLWH